MLANDHQNDLLIKPITKIEIIALSLFSAMIFFLIAQVFYQAHKNKKIEILENGQTTGVYELPNEKYKPQIKTYPEKSNTLEKEIPIPKTEKPEVSEKLEAHVVSELVTEIFSDPDIVNLENKKIIDNFCETVGEKLGSVNVQDCKDAKLQLSGTVSNQNKPLTYRDFNTHADEKSKADKLRVLLVGGIHGDEFSGVSITFKWLNKLAQDYSSNTHSNLNNFHWRIVPILNPDGLLQPDGQSKRMNANDVDLNRNFPTEDWDEFAHQYWINKRGRDPRRYPGPTGGSEIETQWIVEQIKDFNPHAVISIHAPYGIVDSDGPAEPPKHIGPLQLKILGTYPGSMGRYVGVQKNIPMLTVELKRAGTMPSEEDIDLIWEDIKKWIDNKVLNNEEVAAMQSIRHEDNDLVIDKKAGD